MEYEGCASEVINHSAVEETAMLGGILVQEEDPLFAVVSRLAAGETFARENLCQRWYRGITKLKWAEELQRSGILLVQKNAAGGSNPEGNKEQKKDENDDADGENVEQGEEEYINADECVARLRREFNFQRVLNVVIYGEDDERAEILKEEHDNISQIVMMMEECMDRQSLIEEAQSRAALVLEVMKPRITSRYSYAWGVKTYSTFKPVKAEMDRLRPADRHKPAYMRSKQPTCRVPFEHAHYLPNGEQKMVRFLLVIGDFSQRPTKSDPKLLLDLMSNVRGNITPAVVYASNEPNALNASDDGIKNYEAYEDIQSNNSESKFAPFSKLSKKIAAVIPPGGIFASAFNIAATTLGAGIFGLPSTANGSGLVMGILYLVIINCMTIYSMYNLALAAERSKALTYEGVTFVVLGRWAAYAIAAVRAFDGFTSCIAYVISVGDIFSSILKGTDAPEFWKGNTGNRLLTALLWLCCMLPLVIPRHVDSLRHVSTFAVTFMVYFVIVIVVHSCLNGLPENIKDVSVGKSDTAAIILFNSGNAAVEGLGVFMFSYTCQDTAYEIYMDMKDRSVRKFVISSAIAMCMCTVLYILTVFFGYMDFGRDVTGSILLMYDPVNEPAVMVGMIGVLVKLIASYALLAMACRNALYSIAGKNADVLPFWKHCASVVTLSVAALVLGLFIPKVNTVLGFAGSITGGSLGYIFPSLLLMYSGGFTWQRVGPFHYLVAYGLLISGVVGVVFGTGATIWGTIVG